MLGRVPRASTAKAESSLAAQRAPVALRGRRRRRVVAVVLARAPVVAAVVRAITVLLVLAAAPGPPRVAVEGVAPARSIAVTHLGPNGLKIEK